MWFIDQRVEQEIEQAQKRGDFDNLPGAGQRLELDDDSHVPHELRVAWRILKNAGYLPPELEARREAIELCELMHTLDSSDEAFLEASKRLRVLELRLTQAGVNTDFLTGHYAQQIKRHLQR